MYSSPPSPYILTGDRHDFPSPYEALKLGSQLMNSDGGKTYLSHFRSWFEYNDPGVAQMSFLFKLPRWMKWLYVKWVRHVRRDEIWAGLVEGWSEKTVPEQWALVKQREVMKTLWFEWWQKKNIDFLITPPNAAPAVPEGGMKEAFSGCGYTFLFNIVSGTLYMT